MFAPKLFRSQFSYLFRDRLLSFEHSHSMLHKRRRLWEAVQHRRESTIKREPYRRCRRSCWLQRWSHRITPRIRAHRDSHSLKIINWGVWRIEQRVATRTRNRKGTRFGGQWTIENRIFRQTYASIPALVLNFQRRAARRFDRRIALLSSSPFEGTRWQGDLFVNIRKSLIFVSLLFHTRWLVLLNYNWRLDPILLRTPLRIIPRPKETGLLIFTHIPPALSTSIFSSNYRTRGSHQFLQNVISKRNWLPLAASLPAWKTKNLRFFAGKRDTNGFNSIRKKQVWKSYMIDRYSLEQSSPQSYIPTMVPTLQPGLDRSIEGRIGTRPCHQAREEGAPFSSR